MSACANLYNYICMCGGLQESIHVCTCAIVIPTGAVGDLAGDYRGLYPL